MSSLTETMEKIQKILQNSGTLEVKDKDGTNIYTISLGKGQTATISDEGEFWKCTYCDEDIRKGGIYSLRAILQRRALDYNGDRFYDNGDEEDNEFSPVYDKSDPTQRLITYACRRCDEFLTTAQILRIEPEWNANMAQTILGAYPTSTGNSIERPTDPDV